MRFTVELLHGTCPDNIPYTSASRCESARCEFVLRAFMPMYEMRAYRIHRSRTRSRSRTQTHTCVRASITIADCKLLVRNMFSRSWSTHANEQMNGPFNVAARAHARVKLSSNHTLFPYSPCSFCRTNLVVCYGAPTLGVACNLSKRNNRMHTERHGCLSMSPKPFKCARAGGTKTWEICTYTPS